MLERLGIEEIDKSLYARPLKEYEPNKPHHKADEKTVHQADLVYLPNDKGYLYALVVVDVGTGTTDAEPMKDRKAIDALTAIRTIYARGPLAYPTFEIQVDQGKEFLEQFKTHFHNKGILVRYAEVGRHRQQALAENRNKLIGEAIFMHQTAREQVTGTTHTSWVHILPDIIKVINESAAERLIKKRKRLAKIEQDLNGETADVTCSGSACNLLAKGTKVRVLLDNPVDYVSGNNLHGGFRACDMRWSPDVKVITGTTLAPGQPPFYRVDNAAVNYTRKQLQVVKPDHEPDATKLRLAGESDQRLVHKLVAREKRDGVIKFLTRWYGFKNAADMTWEPRTHLLVQVPKLVREFEKNMKH